MRIILLQKLRGKLKNLMKGECIVLSHIKRMTGLCMFVGIFFPQTKQIIVVTGSIQEEQCNGFLVIQLLEI